jgi:uncharacterized protein YqfA (UPF0365 family)
MNSLNDLVLVAGQPMNVVFMIIIVVLALVGLVAFLFFIKFFRLWLQAKLSRADVKFAELIGMWLRKVDTRMIVISKITAIQAGLPGFGEPLLGWWPSS